MEIKYVNDGKEKYQSYEAIVSLIAYDSVSSANLEVIGYGGNKDEAKANLLHRLTGLKDDLIKLIEATE